VTAPGKDRRKVEAGSLLCYRANAELGSSQTELAQRIPLNQPAISNAVKGGASLVREREYSLEGEK